MHFFKSKKKNFLPLYNKIVFLTRKSFFYKDFKLFDSFSNRIYLIFFHLSFILIAIKNIRSDKDDQQAIFDFFFKQIELNCRELGYGDITVNKKMKHLIKLFYEILIPCENWKLFHRNIIPICARSAQRIVVFNCFYFQITNFYDII